ncbi:MAG: D-alanine--D-alanine ligase [Deltaproteobacteria bacterium]|nr:D-alanine--D-alanine ligase [Deltaproteobacteria bacterium]
MKRQRIGVLLGGLSAEREVSLETGRAALGALTERGYATVAIDVDLDVAARLRAEGVQVAFLALHGRWGEDGCIQGLLESLRIPYTGSGVLASALAMDKVVSKRMFVAAGLPTAAYGFPATVEEALGLGLPVVVKPRAEGSSVGVTVVHDEAQLEAAIARANQGTRGGALVERYVPGRELSVAVMGSGDSARALGSVEIRAAVGHYDYEAKYQRDDTSYFVPAPLDDGPRRRLEEIAVEAHRLLDCAGATRVDLRWDGLNDPVILEVNTLPGMTSHSLLPKIAAHLGWSYGELVERILLDAALKA